MTHNSQEYIATNLIAFQAINTLATAKFYRMRIIFSAIHKEEHLSALFAYFVGWADAESPTPKDTLFGYSDC